MNHPPAAAGGIVGILLFLGRLGMNHPPAAAGGIYKARTCVKINGRRQPVGRSLSPTSIASYSRAKARVSLDRLQESVYLHLQNIWRKAAVGPKSDLLRRTLDLQ